ncbi:unnamed protein product [Cuscuta epithymum]|uniref:Uncharacterized protein n=1 Tax=Cuscuta epithymum TaxID=186058 RepID=A0AAV0E234_9ASTE|nr:unnamed protein product [Cuscuta epithymum]
MCTRLNYTYDSLQQLSVAPLTPLESGCCLPPQSCSFVSPTNWTSNQTSSSLGDDCSRWNNGQLCFNCDSCKAALLAQSSKIVEKIGKLTFGVNMVCSLYALYFILFKLYVHHYPDPDDIQP